MQHTRHSFDNSYSSVFIISRGNDVHDRLFSGWDLYDKVGLLRALTVHPQNPQLLGEIGEMLFVFILCNFMSHQSDKKNSEYVTVAIKQTFFKLY